MAANAHIVPEDKILALDNFPIWKDYITARLRAVGSYRIVFGTHTKPSDPADSLGAEAKEKVFQKIEDWEQLHDKAISVLLSSIDAANRQATRAQEDNAVDLYKALRDRHLNQTSSTRFHALDTLFSIRKTPDESPIATFSRVDAALTKLQSLTPDGFTAAQIHAELAVMAYIASLPREEYGSFISSLLLIKDLDQAAVVLAMKNEETQRRPRGSDTTQDFALAAKHSNKPSASSTTVCHFCDRPGHFQADCRSYVNAKSHQARRRAERAQGGSNKTANASQATTGSTGSTEAAKAATASPPPSHATGTSADSLWNTDTGATSSMTRHRHWLRNYTPHVIPIQLANDHVVYSSGIGEVEFQPVINGVPACPVVFTRVLHVPALQSNLLSVLHLTSERGVRVTISKRGFIFQKGRETILTASLKGKAAFLDGYTVPDLQQALSATVDRSLLHRRLAHIGSDRLERLLREQLATGISVTSQTPLPPICAPCIAGKQHREPFPKVASNRATGVLDRVHCDLHGPMDTQTHSHRKYWITFIDDYSRYEWCALLHAKSDALAAFKVFKAQAELETGKRIKIFRDDKGGEFASKEWDSFLQAEGIKRERTVRATPQQNGVAERRNRTHDNGIVSMLEQAHFPKSMWGEALALHVRILNATPTSALSGTTPFEAVFNSKPDLSALRVFGCRAFVHVGDDKRKSLESHTMPCVYLGFEEGYKGYKCWNPATQKVVISRDVIFDESLFPGLSKTPQTTQVSPIVTEDIPVRPRRSAARPAPNPVPAIPQRPVTPPAPPVAPVLPPLPPVQRAPPPPVPPRPARAGGSAPPEAGPSRPNLRPNPKPFNPDWYKVNMTTLHRAPRQRSPTPPRIPSPPAPSVSPPPAPRAPIVLVQPSDDEEDKEDEEEHEEEEDDEGDDLSAPGDSGPEEALMAASLDYLCGDGGFLTNVEAWEYCYSVVADSSAPKTFAAAMRTPQHAQWLQAAKEELEAHLENGTWELVELPPGKRAIGSRWIFKVKKHADGSFERYKARVVAKRYSQRPGLDFEETFAPTTKWASLRAFFAIAAAEDLELESLDISTAYLNGVLAPEHEVYMEQPEGFAEGGPTRACRLRKGLYGLKQGGRLLRVDTLGRTVSLIL